MEFFVYETQQLIKAKQRPIIIITSNNEKELPDAFLRRCFFHYIKFPSKVEMQQIIDVHHPAVKQALLAKALEIFFDLRDLPGMKKKPSTSELIDWLKLLMADEIAQDLLINNKSDVIPLFGALLKNEQDVSLLEKLVFMSRRDR
jgi:MoxR-like ATPase